MTTDSIDQELLRSMVDARDDETLVEAVQRIVSNNELLMVMVEAQGKETLVEAVQRLINERSRWEAEYESLAREHNRYEN